MLSWFELSGRGRPATLMEQAVAEALEDASRSGATSSESSELMVRVLAARAEAACDAIPLCAPGLAALSNRLRVLLVDQACGDRGDGAALERMVAAALAEHPAAEFWVWPVSGGKRGHLARLRGLPAGIRMIDYGFSLFATLPHVDHFYTVSAPEGMQALLAGVPVHVYGRPFYAGWGLTHDDLKMPDRHAKPTLASLFDVVYLRLARYFDPETHRAGTLAQVLDSIELQRNVRGRYADCAQVAGLEFRLWKRHFATPFLSAGGGELRWSGRPADVKPGEFVALWGAKSDDGIPSDTSVLRMEDGFFHSDGLGSDMNAPCSQVVDRLGLYFDARRPSELTHILNDTHFDTGELERAGRLRELVARLGVTKYNLGRRTPAWHAPDGKKVILVPGQVADDASIRFGTGVLGTAEALLEEVRRRNPESFIVYKPHPDVLSGNRAGLVEARELADIVDGEADLLSLVDLADEVHVLSSLAGFDALLRGKRVFTYGLPFYAGWGLTEDVLPQPWRRRTLTLDMLVAGALLRYPIYWDWRTGLFTTPEAVVRNLGQTAGRPLTSIASDRGRLLRKIWRWCRNAVRHGYWAWQRRGPRHAH
ncbi:capsular polysaccharide biosynthesis protein [Cupriavidus sp. PET2-C1]